MYALIKKGIMNHNMWSIFSTIYIIETTVLLSVILVACLLKVMRAMDI